MNILVITQMYSQPDDVGANKPTKTVNYFAKEWIAAGHKVVVMHCPSKFPLVYYMMPSFLKNRISGRISTMTPPAASRRDLHWDENGIDVYRFPMLKFFPGQCFSDKQMEKHAEKICRTLDKIGFKPDLVAGHFANPSAELTRIIAHKYQSMSSIVFHHDCDRNEVIKYRLKENCKSIRAIGARSVVEAGEVRNNLGLQQLPFVCCSGVPNDAVMQAEKTCSKHDYRNGIKYLYVGSMIKRKHLDVVIKAFSKIAESNDTLRIVAGGQEEIKMKELVKDLGIEDKVIFTGRVPRDKALQYMKESHILTLISDDETYGMVYIEAMLQGCLTIASWRGGFDGIIVDGENGFICTPGSESELIDIYKRIRSMNPETRNAIGQKAINIAMEFSEKDVAERYLNDVIHRTKTQAV